MDLVGGWKQLPVTPAFLVSVDIALMCAYPPTDIHIIKIKIRSLEKKETL